MQKKITIKIVSVYISYLIYVLLFFLLLPYAGEKVSILTIIPIIFSSFYWGIKKGLYSALILIPINTLLLEIGGYSSLIIMLHNLPGVAGIFIIGGAVGYLSELNIKNKSHFKRIDDEITGRKKVEEESLESERKYKSVIDSVKEIIFETDARGNWIFLSPFWEEMTGYKVEDCLNKNSFEFIHPEDKILSKKKFFVILKSESQIKTHEVRYLTKKGDYKWVRVSIQPIFNGNGKLTGTMGTLNDITTQKIAKEKINVRERALNATMNSVVITNPNLPDNPVVYCNPAFEKLTGYSSIEVLGKNLHFLCGPGTKREKINIIKEAIHQEKECKVVILNYKKDNTPFWNELSISPIKDSEGNLISFIGIQSDVTERIIEEASLRKSEKMSRLIFEQSGDGLILFDEAGTILEWNKSLENITEITSQEAIGKKLWDVQSQFLKEDKKTPEYLEEFRTIIIRFLISGISPNLKDYVEDKFYLKSGKEKIITTKMFSIKMESGFLGCSIIRDLTRQKKDEAEIKKLSRAVETSPSGILLADLNGTISYVNPSVVKMCKYKNEDEILKRSLFKISDPKSNLILQNEIIPLLKKGGTWNGILNIFRKDGSLMPVEMNCALINHEEPTFLLAVFNDITERIKAEKEIKLALDKEKELNELKSRFVSTVSHEFRTPLTSILASSELLQRYFYKWNDEKKLSTLKRVEKSVEYMNELINDVLTINRADSGRMEFNPAPTNLIELSNDILEEIKVAAQPSHKFEFVYDSECKNVIVDEKILRTIIINLLSNSVKYSPQGGSIYFSIKKLDSTIEINVKDEGLGISDVDQKKLFQPFFRGSNIENISGTGLGLSILQRSVNLHKGKIDFQSEVGKGTNFIITIPENI